VTSRLHHEEIYRGGEAMKKLADGAVHICGAGALGSNIAVNLARIGVRKLTVIDRDRVEQHNIGTQVYAQDDVGGRKAEILRNILCRELGLDVQAHAQELTDKNIAKLLKGAQLVLDTFDNTQSRQLIADYCRANNIFCLHAGVNDEYAEAVWNDNYRVPSDAGLDICDYPLARNLILLTTAVASEALVRFLTQGVKENYSMTIGDLSINREKDL